MRSSSSSPLSLALSNGTICAGLTPGKKKRRTSELGSLMYRAWNKTPYSSPPTRPGRASHRSVPVNRSLCRSTTWERSTTASRPVDGVRARRRGHTSLNVSQAVEVVDLVDTDVRGLDDPLPLGPLTAVGTLAAQFLHEVVEEEVGGVLVRRSAVMRGGRGVIV